MLPIYGALFALWSVVLVGVVQWDTNTYLSGVVDELLEQRARYLRSIDRAHLPDAMIATGALDLRDVMYFGLFDKTGSHLSGNMSRKPEDLTLDGVVRRLPQGVLRADGTRAEHVRGLALPLSNGEFLVLARDTRVIDRVGNIIQRSLLWGLSLTAVPGLIGGVLLARGPLRRVHAMEVAVQPIMRGDLRQRLPVSSRRDELDLLAGIVNTMLDEIERLMSEVKGVCDSIAHDLRTPLTRVRAQLYRLQRDPAHGDARQALVEQAIIDVDGLLERFRALLRISELEDLHRRAGFTDCDLRNTLESVREIYTPLAEDRQILLQVRTNKDMPHIHGDPHLLLEALSNIVDNAIKFTPSAGRIQLGIEQLPQGLRLDVIDTGPGIPLDQRSAVLLRFYRHPGSQVVAGSGLGLSIVAAIVKLHGFRLEIASGEHGVGSRVSIQCWPEH